MRYAVVCGRNIHSEYRTVGEARRFAFELRFATREPANTVRVVSIEDRVNEFGGEEVRS